MQNMERTMKQKVNDSQQYFLWVDIDGKPITTATPFFDIIELSAEQESSPKGALGIRTGTKETLQKFYGLNDLDFKQK